MVAWAWSSCRQGLTEACSFKWVLLDGDGRRPFCGRWWVRSATTLYKNVVVKKDDLNIA
jgi:hypothetical protein